MPTFPFSAIVGQDEMRQALLIAAVDPAVGALALDIPVIKGIGGSLLYFVDRYGVLPFANLHR